MGTLHLNETVLGVAVDGERIWFAAGNRVYLADAGDPWRFYRLKEDDRQRCYAELPHPASGMALSPDGSLWAAAGDSLYEISPSAGPALQAKRVCGIAAGTAKLIAVGRELRLLTSEGRLFRWKQGMEQPEFVAEHVVDWDAFGENEAGIVRDGARLQLRGMNSRLGTDWNRPWDGAASEASLICLGDAMVCLNVEGTAYFGDLSDSDAAPTQIPTERKVTAMARARETGNRVVALATAAGDPPNRPQFTCWDYSNLT
jgi:hypothetical protein